MGVLLQASIQTFDRGGWHLEKPLAITLEHHQGLVLRGPNGSGKTSLLLALAGLLPFDGAFDQQPAPERLRLKVSQADGPGSLTVKEHLDFWRVIYGASLDQKNHRVDLYGLKPYLDIPLRHLSYGLGHRVALARLGLGSCDIWLLDEPFSGLDEQTGALLESDLRSFLNAGGGVVMASHTNLMDWPEISLLNSLVCTLQSSRIV